MPWSSKQQKALQARAHGWKGGPETPFSTVSPRKAAELLKEAESRKKGQDEAIRKRLVR